MAKRNKLYKDRELGLVRRSHPDEPVVKDGEDSRSYWRVMELIPDTHHYTAYQRLDVLMAFAATGSIAEVRKLYPDIPRETINFWRNGTTWWKPALREVRDMMSDELDARQTKILNALYTQMQDRLENGDEVVSFDKFGDVRRASKKVGFKDLAIGGGVVFDKRQLGRGEPTARTEHMNESERLQNLQDKFKRIARTDARIIEGEVVKDDDDN
jgi:hypothetical protein